jgi:hypothetical protein
MDIDSRSGMPITQNYFESEVKFSATYQTVQASVQVDR